MTVLRSPSGAWSSGDEAQLVANDSLLRSNRNAYVIYLLQFRQLFWRLDVWEDDSRRRRRFVPNVYGSKHEEASIITVPGEGQELSEVEKLKMLANRWVCFLSLRSC